MHAQVMSEWLAEKKLDRKLLGTLSANLAAVEAWEEFEGDEVINALEELVADVAGEPREASAALQLPEASNEEVRDIVPQLAPLPTHPSDGNPAFQRNTQWIVLHPSICM